MESKSEIDPGLQLELDLLRDSPARSPVKQMSGRAAFLRQAQELAGAVTPTQKWRHNGWMHALQTIFVIHRKEQSPMFSTLATIVLLVSLVLGGGGVTVAAAQNSQPDQPLYGVKIWSEDVRTGFSADPQYEYQLALEFTTRRAAEIQAMLMSGTTPPEPVQGRYQNQVEQAVQYALALPDAQAVQALEQIRTRLQTQQHAFLQVQPNGSPEAETALLRTRQMLQERLQWVETGLSDPAKLRDQLRLRDQLHKQNPQTTATQAGKPTQDTPVMSGGNPWTTGTPTPGSGYGPGKGTGDCENCTPTGSGQGGNPWTTGTPTPGSGYGPGPGPDTSRTCTPGAGNGPGPQPAQPQNNQPTQAGPQSPQGPQSTPSGPGPQPTAGQGGPGGNH